MIRITNNHVGFGDFIHMAICENHEVFEFIIDCGSNSKNKAYKDSIHRYDNGSSFILSHFHDDHYGLICDSGYTIDTFYIRQPSFNGSFIDFIAVACLKIICQEDYEFTSAWFIVNIIERILHHFKYNNIYFFADNETIWSKGKYSIRSIPYSTSRGIKEICEFISYFEGLHKGLREIIYKLSKCYWNFSRNLYFLLSSISEVINKLLEYRERIISTIPISNKNEIFDIYDKVVNNTSAVIGVYESESIKCLFLGDIDVESQKSVYNSVGKVILLKVSHHGTDNYNSPSLLSAFNPQYFLLTYGDERIRNDNTLAAYFKSIYLSTTQNEFDIYEV